MVDRSNFDVTGPTKSSEHYCVRVEGVDFIVNDGRDSLWRIVRWHDGSEWNTNVRLGLEQHDLDREQVVEAAKGRKREKRDFLEAKTEEYL